ncbi:MAG: hypothetical protein ACYSUI_22540 [Planctomycetota bacterium]|jgi:hypothetical protein
MATEKLSVQDRLALLSVLPDKGDITCLRIVRVLREELSFSEDEHASLQLEIKPDAVKWNQAHDVLDKEIELGDKARAVLVDSLRAMDKRKILTELHIPLWERFVENGQCET